MATINTVYCMRLSIRFSETKDKDIIEYLNNCKDKTKGIKAAMRGNLIHSVHDKTLDLMQEPVLDLIQEPVKEKKKVDVMANLIKSTKGFIK